MTSDAAPSRRPRPLALTPPATVYAWAAARFAGLPAALFALDAALADVLRTTSQPLVGQMRLTWWHEALSNLKGSVPAQPVLQALAADALPRGVAPAELARVVQGWEALLEAPLDEAAAARHAARGEALFAMLAGSDAALVREAGAGWALADLAAHATDPAFAAQARSLATSRLDAALRHRWTAAPAVGALALDAAMALAGRGDAGSPRRAMRVLRLRLTGR